MLPTELHTRLIGRLLAGGDPALAEHRRLAREYGLLPLYLDMGGFIGLRADGELLGAAWDGDGGPSVLRDDRWRRRAVVAGAERYPELAALRPARPPSAIACPSCGGTGRPAVAGFRCVCAGLGWVLPGEIERASRP